MESAANLITDDTYALFTEKDIAIFSLGVFLHDLGMHLQPLTFKHIVTGGYDDVLSKEFGDEKWSVLWQTYLSESKKFNDNQRRNIFGDVSVDLREPPDLNNPDSLTGVHRKLIGEFIRRHHPRIAYEVAFKGLTSHDDKQIDFCSDFDKDYRLLAGILARSHGMNLRDTFEILKMKFSKAWRRPYDVHIIYLMTLLRLADYFQIDTHRVLKIPYQTRLFKSPVSFKEHQKHLQTKHIQVLDDNPETLFITAEPTTSVYYLALTDLFRDIQSEIDQSWAVLGEIYGRQRYDQQPKLAVRRVQSNLDDKEVFGQLVDYIPERITFIVDKEIPKLLIGPLYGDNPSCGVRELLQNAVDACFEREFLEQEKGNGDYKGEIVISISQKEGEYEFSIIDNGKA